MDETDVGFRIEELRDEVVGWRRRLHQNPELAFEEEATSRFVYETLESFGGLELSRAAGTGVVARLRGGAGGGPTIALRADMDALPITEETGLPFASENDGVMHACGHDGHTAYLLGAAKILSGMKDELCGEIRFLFQPAEENGKGARKMVEDGVMEGVDTALGTHLVTRYPVGTVAVAYGPSSASVDTFRIVIDGDGGHAARPHQTVDAVPVAAQVVLNLQQIVSREADPLDGVVLSVTKINGGTAVNTIAGRVELEGTARVLSAETREVIPELIERVVKGVCEAHRASYSFEFQRLVGPVVNDAPVSEVVEGVARRVFGEEAVVRRPPSMGGEDFSNYREAVPRSSFVVIGAANEEKGATHPNHHPCFDMDEDALQDGVKLFVHSALELLDDGGTKKTRTRGGLGGGRTIA